MYKNNSKGKPYYTQRNNKIKPGSSCNVTSMIAALSAAGWPVEKMVAKNQQAEDDLLLFIMTDAVVDKKWRSLDPEGKIPPNEWHAVLAFGTNRWLKSKGYNCLPVVFSEAVALDEIQKTVKAGGACVVSGRFPYKTGSLNHVVAVVGIDETSLIVDDPFGDWHDEYATIKGDDIKMDSSEFYSLLKPLGAVKKWAHIVEPFKEVASYES